MPIPIQASNYHDVAAAFAALETHVRAALDPLAGPETPTKRTSTEAPETAARLTPFGLLKRTDTYVVDGGHGRRAEVEVRWQGGAPAALEWSVRDLGPGATNGAPGCVGGVAVFAAWVVLAVSNFGTIVALRGRMLGIVVMGGLLAAIVTSLVALGVVGALFQAACRRLSPARCRAAAAFTANEVRPAVTRAVGAFVAAAAPKA